MTSEEDEAVASIIYLDDKSQGLKCVWVHKIVHMLNPVYIGSLIKLLIGITAVTSGRAVKDVDLRPLVFWDCGFESRRRLGYQSVVSVVRCQLEFSATGRSHVQRRPTRCGMSKCDSRTS